MITNVNDLSDEIMKVGGKPFRFIVEYETLKAQKRRIERMKDNESAEYESAVSFFNEIRAGIIGAINILYDFKILTLEERSSLLAEVYGV